MPDVVPVQTAPAPALPTPCGPCPWRTANHGRRHPDGWYTKANLRRLWAGMRNGEAMSCHPTDPRNPVPDGWRRVAPDTVTRECRGFQILVAREWSLIERIANLLTGGNLSPAGPGRTPTAFQVYRRLRRRGLTTQGVGALVERETFGGTGLSRHANKFTQPIDLDQPVGIDSDALPWPITDDQINEAAVTIRR